MKSWGHLDHNFQKFHRSEVCPAACRLQNSGVTFHSGYFVVLSLITRKINLKYDSSVGQCDETSGVSVNMAKRLEDSQLRLSTSDVNIYASTRFTGIRANSFRSIEFCNK